MIENAYVVIKLVAEGVCHWFLSTPVIPSYDI